MRQPVLTGVGKIFNGLKYDYPIEECVMSILQAADEFILVVCEDSEDDTVEFCRRFAKKEPRLTLLYDVWRKDKNEKYTNMVRLANKAISKVKTDWFISIDMDEIIPQKDALGLIPYILWVPKEVTVIQLRFHHMYYDINHEILGKLYPHIHRIARKGYGWESGSDGCGLTKGKGVEYTSHLSICHYGFLREMKAALEKETRFQKELYFNGNCDERLEKFGKSLPETPREFWQAFVSEDDTVIPYSGNPQHPLAIKRYT